MIQEILTDRAALHHPCTRVEDITEVNELIGDLVQTAMTNIKDCVALAANQIGGTKRVFVIRMNNGSFMPLINPEIISTSKQVQSKQELCMSVVNGRGEKLKVMKRRFKKIQIKFTDQTGQDHTMKIEKFGARVFQHELDHLNGKLISD